MIGLTYILNSSGTEWVCFGRESIPAGKVDKTTWTSSAVHDNLDGTWTYGGLNDNNGIWIGELG